MGSQSFPFSSTLLPRARRKKKGEERRWKEEIMSWISLKNNPLKIGNPGISSTSSFIFFSRARGRERPVNLFLLRVSFLLLRARWKRKGMNRCLADERTVKIRIISQVLPAVTHDFLFHSTDPSFFHPLFVSKGLWNILLSPPPHQSNVHYFWRRRKKNTIIIMSIPELGAGFIKGNSKRRPS